jgi:tetratricopeptide (TPR) repeat protein
MLVPVIGLVQVGSQSMADRYTYLPLIGIFIAVTWTAGELVQRLKWPRTVLASVAALILVACSSLTWKQIGYWRNSETLFLHTIETTGRNSLAHYNLASFYYVANRLPEAIEHYRKAVEIRPTYDDALNNMGAALASDGRLDEGIVAIRQAIRLRPEKADAHYNLGNVLAMERRLDEAVEAYEEALKLTPDSPHVHNNLANVLAMQGKKDEAVFHYRETLRLKPDHAGARRQLELMGLQP